MSSDCNPEAYIDAAYLAVESIKVIASTLSPTAGQKLIESSFTSTPRERLRNFTIPRKEDLPPDSLREESSPSAVWHSNNFPQDGAKAHYNIGCITNPKENEVYGKKQPTKDNAVDNSDVSLWATKTNEVTQIHTKNPTCVLIIPFKGTNGEETDEFQVLQLASTLTR